MNILKFLVCWWHRRHIPMGYYDARRKPAVMCIRCGKKL